MSNGVKNPIVEAVRDVRAEIARDCDYDLRKLLDRLKKDQIASGRPTGSPRKSKMAS